MSNIAKVFKCITQNKNMRNCSQCGEDYTPKWGRQKRCERCQKEKGYLPTKEKEKSCLFCKIKFTTLNGRKIYCSSKCMQRAKRQNNLEHYRAYQREWNKTNPYIKERRNAWRKRNRKKCTEWSIRYAKNHPEKIRQIRIKRYLRIKLRHILSLGGRCSRCGYAKNLTALDLHHKNKNEKEGITESHCPQIDYKKFILLCANCHREEHNPEFTIEYAKKRLNWGAGLGVEYGG